MSEASPNQLTPQADQAPVAGWLGDIVARTAALDRYHASLVPTSDPAATERPARPANTLGYPVTGLGPVEQPPATPSTANTQPLAYPGVIAPDHNLYTGINQGEHTRPVAGPPEPRQQ